MNKRLLLAASSGILFCLLAALVVFSGYPQIDQSVASMQRPSPIISDFFIVLTEKIFDTLSIGILTLGIAAYFWYNKRRRDSVLFSVGMISTVAIATILKYVLAIERPDGGLIEETTFAFPSRHAAAAVVFFGLLLYLHRDKLKSKLWPTIAIAFVLLVGLGRVYLNVHWLSDIVGGYLLGISLAGLLIFLYENYAHILPSYLR